MYYAFVASHSCAFSSLFSKMNSEWRDEVAIFTFAVSRLTVISVKIAFINTMAAQILQVHVRLNVFDTNR